MAVAQAQRIREIAAGAVTGAGLVVEDVRLSPAGRRTVVRITVDLPATELGGVPMDAVAAAAKAVSEALDEADVMGTAPYVLEVTSPGVDRPLTERRHWLRARGRVVAAAVTDLGELHGRLTAVDDQGVTIDRQQVPWSTVGRGRVEIEFRRDDAVDGGERAEGPGEGLDSWTST